MAGRRHGGADALHSRPADQEACEPVELVSRNEVLLVGRVSGVPEQRELPSGDLLVAWRLVVTRPVGSRRPPPGVRSPTVDTVDCVAWSAGLRRSARSMTDGDVVEVYGALRRRFWRAGAGAASRCEVEVSRIVRLTRAR